MYIESIRNQGSEGSVQRV